LPSVVGRHKQRLLAEPDHPAAPKDEEAGLGDEEVTHAASS
jgi:hypothetical protein